MELAPVTLNHNGKDCEGFVVCFPAFPCALGIAEVSGVGRIATWYLRDRSELIVLKAFICARC